MVQVEVETTRVKSRSGWVVPTISIAMALAALGLSYRANQIAGDANDLALDQAMARPVLIDLSPNGSTIRQGEAVCLYRVRLANVGAAGTSLVGFSANASFRGDSRVLATNTNYASLAEVIPNGPGFFVIFLTDLSAVEVFVDLTSDARDNAIDGPLNLAAHSAQDFWIAVTYRFDDTTLSFESTTNNFGDPVPLPDGFAPVRVEFGLRFASDDTLSTSPEDCWALGPA